MVFRNIRFRGVNGQTVALSGTGQVKYSEDDIKKITSVGIDYAIRQIASELVCPIDAYDPWQNFNYELLTTPEKLYLHLLELNPMTPSEVSTYTSIVGSAIKNGKEIINELLLKSQNGGLPEGFIDNVQNQNVIPFLEKSPLMGGSAAVINTLLSELDKALKNSCGSTNIIRTLKDLLLVLKEGKTFYIQYLTEKRKSQEISLALNKMAYKIKCLEQILAEITRNEMFMTGKISMKINKPKPAIYALAIIDLYDAWYKFLYPGCSMDYTKLEAITDYVKTIGSEEEARTELYNLLDVIYIDPFTDLTVIDVILEENPYYSWLPSAENWSGPGVKVPADEDYRDKEYHFDNTTSEDDSDLDVSVFQQELRYAGIDGMDNALVLRGSVNLKKNRLVNAHIDNKGRHCHRTRKHTHRCKYVDGPCSSSDESDYKVSIFSQELKYLEVQNLGDVLVLNGSVCLKKNKLQSGNNTVSLEPCSRKSRRRRVRCRTVFKPYCS